jgi:integrase/recombinase XerD
MDIHDYKKRLERVEEKVRKSNLSEKNKKILFDFERQLFIKEFTTARIETYLSVLRVICEKTNKDLDSFEKEDIELFLEWLQRRDLADWTKYSYKMCFKSFLKANGKNDLANLIIIKNVKNKIPDIFTREEVLKMIDNAVHPMDRALIAALYETGCRIGELAGLQNKDIHFDNYGAIFIVNGKTGMRRVRAINSAPYLSAWLDVHPRKLDPNAPFWIRMGGIGRTNGLEGNNCRQLMYPALTMRIKRIAKRAGIQKRVYNHLFRHTSATEKSGILTDSMMDEYFGWIQGSRMTRIYVHRSGKNLDEALLKAHGLVKDNTPQDKELAPIKCPRCGTINGATGKFCYKCSAALDLVTAVNVDKERASLTMELMDLIRQEPAILELLKGHMEARNETEKIKK